MTGAVIPEGADAVQMVEQSEELSPREVIIKRRSCKATIFSKQVPKQGRAPKSWSRARPWGPQISASSLQ